MSERASERATPAESHAAGRVGLAPTPSVARDALDLGCPSVVRYVAARFILRLYGRIQPRKGAAFTGDQRTHSAGSGSKLFY